MGFSDELWDGFEAVAQRNGEGKKITEEMIAFFKKRADIERKYAKSLFNLVKVCKLSDLGTLEDSWKEIKIQTEGMARAHQNFSETLSTEVEEPVRQWVVETQKQRRNLKASGKKLLGELAVSEQGVQKAKSKYEGTRKKQDTLQGEIRSDPQNTKLNKKLIAETKNAEGADDQYRKSVERQVSVEGRMYDSEMPQILRDFQSMESRRINLLKNTFSAFEKAQSQIPPVWKQSCEAIADSVSKIEPDKDIQLFIQQTKTGQQPPGRTEYEPYDSTTGACKPSGTTITGMSSSGPVSVSSGPSSFGTPPPQLQGLGRADLSGQMTTIPVGGERKSADPIARSTINPMGQNQYNTIGGPRGVPLGGMSPAGFNTLPINSQPPLANDNFNSAVQPDPVVNEALQESQVRALYNYTGVEDTELSFQEGDLITVTYKDESGWWEGELNGVVGVFPSNHVQEVGAEDEYYDDYYEDWEKCKAIYEYKAEDEDELSIAVGDIMTIEDEDDEGWYYGTQESSGAYGKFPSNYVEILTE
eukprot:CAMPEP_0174255746 /NCGR_PEP_ID=MMETSP0439-20130205/5054_1 /TAXON_ID=0 /ORGANISM="Stereomyxa ramosa, Strain Chinc5" /LENGTH=529 /DNA_ID=CAMNT_0015338067 /DNA_START=28 /DNA_END=1617 /DNA_ORIENTATION=+